MTECVTPKCWRPGLQGHLFCKDCRRLLSDDERYALRMIMGAPAYSPAAWTWIDGREQMWAWGPADAQGYREGVNVKGVSAICDALHWAEYKMACIAIGKRLARVRLRQAAKHRLSLRRR